MRLDRLVASIGAEDSVVATTIGMSGRVRLTSGGALSIEADSPEALVAWLGEATAKAQLLVPAETAPEPTQRQVRYDELVVGDVLSSTGATVSAPFHDHGNGHGHVGTTTGAVSHWGRHLVWVDLPRPADQAADAAVTVATVWQEEIPWHDVIVGDEIRLAGEWLHVSSVGIDRVRRGNREVVAHPVPLDVSVHGNRTVISVEPTQTVTVRFPRSACTEAVAS
jgi:hypothetical protein